MALPCVVRASFSGITVLFRRLGDSFSACRLRGSIAAGALVDQHGTGVPETAYACHVLLEENAFQRLRWV